MSNVSESGLKRILNAALALFGRNGFNRTTMADIAREAEVSRATLYLRFSDKAAVFEALATSLVDDALASAKAAWVPDHSFSSNIAATLLAKDLGFFRLIRASPHGGEVFEVHAERAAAHIVRLDTQFSKLLAKRGQEAAKGGADLTVFDGPKGFATFLATTGSGLKHEARTEELFRSAIERLARVTARAAGQT